MNRIGGSFRDPSGQVFLDGDRVKRTVNACYREHWEQFCSSGFMARAVDRGLVVPFSECATIPGSWKTLEVEPVPFLSFPYEWCFSQLKDAALLTLTLQQQALESGMLLKDASAYNVQFAGTRPLFIDLLSFEILRDGAPWQAYRQFCRHFLAPLALCSRRGLWCGTLSRLWIDGIPLEYACAMLPWLTRLNPALALHLFAHARMEKRHAGAPASATRAKRMKLSRKALANLALSLQAAVENLDCQDNATPWSDYYSDTNYTNEATAEKLRLVAAVAGSCPGRLALDLGANTGRFSRELAPHFSHVLSADMDSLAVERNYLTLKKSGPTNILPMVIDLRNPSPGLGWACTERDSFSGRCKADLLTALALIHHLVIDAGIPMAMVAEYFATLIVPNGRLLIEFVPKTDSQVQRLLASRRDVFENYTLAGLRTAFEKHFSHEAAYNLPDSDRTLICFTRRQQTQ